MQSGQPGSPALPPASSNVLGALAGARRPNGTSRSLQALLFLLLWAPYARLTQHFHWVCDDAYISYRYAQNWAAGEGLRFNPGEHVPVEGFSNFLWVVQAALVERLGGDVARVSTGLSFLAGSVLLALVLRTLLVRFRVGTAAALVGAALLALAPPFAVWSTSGLETAPFALALFVTFERLVLRRGGIAPVQAALAALALALLRVEGIHWALVLAVLAAYSRARAGERVLRPLGAYLGILLLTYGAYWAARYAYFGLPLSNTTYAKVALGPETIARGARYVVANVLAFPALLLALLGPFLGRGTERRAPLLALAALPLGVLAFAVLVSGDFMPMGRWLVPAWPFLALVLGIGLAQRRAPALAAGAALVLANLLPAWNLHVVPESVRAAWRFRGAESKEFRTEHEQWVRIKEGTPRQTLKGRALGLYGKPGESLVTGAIGAVAYFSNLFVFDQNGLVTRSVTLRDTTGEPLRKPGHDKHVSEAFFLDQRPTILESRILARERLEPSIEEWSAGPYATLYAPDAMRLPPELVREGKEYLLVLRRIEEGTKPRRAWAEAREAIARLP